MRISDYIVTAQTNLTRSKLRTFLTVLAILVGTFTLTLTTSVGTGIQQFGEQQLRAQAQPDTAMIFTRSENGDAFNSSKKVAEYNPNENTPSVRRSSLTQTDLDKIKSLTNITGAWFGRNIVTEYIQRGDGKKYLAALDALYPMTKLDFAAGAMPNADDTSAYVLPYQYLEPLGFATPQAAIGQTVAVRFIEQTAQITNADAKPVEPKTLDQIFTIRAVLVDSAISQSAYVSYQAVDEISAFQFGVSQSPNVIVAGITPGMSKTDTAALKKAFTDKGYDAFMYEDAIAQFTKAISVVQVGLGAFGGIALIAAMIGIVNTLLMAAFERTQEIGLWKALGMRRRGIFATFLYEALSIGFWGGLIGIGLAYGSGKIINQILARTLLKNIEGFTLLVFRWEYMLGVVALAMLIGLVAGVLPAIRASRLDPIEALRHE